MLSSESGHHCLNLTALQEAEKPSGFRKSALELEFRLGLLQSM